MHSVLCKWSLMKTTARMEGPTWGELCTSATECNPCLLTMQYLHSPEEVYIDTISRYTRWQKRTMDVMSTGRLAHKERRLCVYCAQCHSN